MKKLRTRFERLCYQHRSWGIPNLMLYICLGNAIVYLYCTVTQDLTLYSLLRFDRAMVLQGQIWRLFSHVFTYSFGGLGTSAFLVTAISLIFFYFLGRNMEVMMGTLKYNIFYFSGLLMQVIFAMIFGDIEQGYLDYGIDFIYQYPYNSMAYYHHLTLLIGYATLRPDVQFIIMFIIPVKAWILGVLYVVMILLDVVAMSNPVMMFPHNIFPLIPLLSYFLIFGSECRNLLPLGWQTKTQRAFRNHQNVSGRKADPFASKPQDRKQVEYNHRCTICGRTDVSHPNLSFRYCSKCAGYHCYCEDHISNHVHVED